jgi:putative two-component system response regulator
MYYTNTDEDNLTIKAMETKIKTMIIDDSYTNRMLFKVILEDLDIEVIEVCNAIKALDLLNKVTPQIILLDLCLPIMGGIEFLDELRIRKKEIPVIVMSVYDDLDYKREAFNHGASDFLVKPVKIHQLAKRISKYIECETNINRTN